MRSDTPSKPEFLPSHENLLEVRIPRKDDRYQVWFRNFPTLHEELNLIHRHKELEILFCPDDHGVYFINDRQYQIEPGDVFIVNSNEFHQPVLKHPCKSGVRVIYFDPIFVGTDSAIQPWRSAFLFASRFHSHRLKPHPRFRDLFAEFETAFRSENAGWPHLCRGILSYILALIGNSFLDQTMDKGTNSALSDILGFGTVVEYIMEHLDDTIEAQNLYQLAGLSKSQFSQKFKALFGVSASQYIQIERIHRSMALLVSSSLSITEISIACGFNWLGYYNRAFRQHTGMSPSQYRISRKKTC